MNISFEYLYRDAGNYKLYGTIVFKNENNVPLIFLHRAIEACLYQRIYFIPELLEIPRLKFRDYNEDLDHFWHEFDSISETDFPHTAGKTVSKFFELLERRPQYLINDKDLIQIIKEFKK